MADRLKSLTLSGFRGAPAQFVLDFAPEKNLTVLYGANGSGKTTICDALVFLADGEVGSLKDRGLGAGLSQYWPSLGKKLQDIQIVLETEKTRCTARIDKSKPMLNPPASQPRVAVLRRDLMARLTESKPADRYHAISRFIDVSGFEASEANLARLQTDLANQSKNAMEAGTRSSELLRGILTRTGEKTAKTAVEWAKGKAAAADADAAAQIRAMGELLNVIERFEPIPGLVAGSTGRILNARNALAGAEHILAQAAAEAGGATAALVGLLQAGRDYLAAHGNVEACPLCESAAPAAQLPNTIAARLARLQRLQDAVAARGKTADEHKAAMDEARILADQYQQLRRAYGQVVQGHVWPAEIAPPETPARAGLLADWLSANQAKFQGWRELRDRIISQQDLGKSLQEALAQYDDSRTRQAALADLLPAVTKAKEICRAERQLFMDEIIGDIALEVQRLYDAIHPEEGMGDVTFAFDPNKKASLDLYIGYDGQTVPPQAYFSQSHLDTMGLCITVALAKRERPEDVILLLDDVLGSVDAPHMDRVIQMICQESKNFRHVIVTTHDPAFADPGRWQVSAALDVQFIALSPWARDRGMRAAIGARRDTVDFPQALP